MPASCVIYGATGYSGRLLIARARARGLSPVLAGRDAAKLAALAAETGLPWHAAAVTDGTALDQAFAGSRVVLNAAGPFRGTAEPVLDACLRAGAHYLDITGEVRVVERLATRHGDAVRRGIMVMPAVGFDVVPTDCLAAHVARRLPGVRHLVTGVTQPGFLSAGSIRTLIDGVDVGLARRNGAIEPLPVGSVERRFDFGWGPVPCLNVSFADVVTAYYTTGIPNVTTFVEAPPMVRVVLGLSRFFAPVLASASLQSWLQAGTSLLPADPGAGHARDDVTMRVVAEAEDDAGRRARARLRTPEAYALTAAAAVEILGRVLDGDLEPGFQTPARVYGPDLVLTLPGVEREDLD